MIHPGQLLKAHQLYAGKELGQNFLSNPATADMIVAKTGIRDSDHVLEIGPGLGGLTIPLSKAARTVTAVEKDARLLPILENQLSEHGITNVKLVHHDVLTLDISSVAPNKKLVIVGNLPYNISSQIIFKLVKERGRIPQAFLMFQKELAQRIIASPGGRAYSRLAAVVQYAAGVSFVAEIGPAHFFPRPDVDSTILKFEFFQEREFEPDEEEILFNVIKAAFSKRRKSLKNSMAGGEFNYDKQRIVQALERAGIDPARRAETLSVEEFKDLARAVSQTC